MNNELLLLGLLRREDMHGYRLHEFIDQEMASCTDLKKPAAYYLLNKMTEAGWIQEAYEQEGSRPPRKVYSLTSDGEAAFQRLLRENLSGFNRGRFPDDIGLAFLSALPQAEALQLLAVRREAVTEALQAVEAVPEHGGTLQWILEHQVRHLAAELEWVEIIIQRLEESQDVR